MPLPKKVYSPESPMAKPGEFFRSIPAEIGNSLELAWRLTLRDFSAQYRQSFAGYTWAIIPPFFAGFTFIFLQSSGVVSTGETGIPYAAYAIIGTLLWQVFADALRQPITVLQRTKTMLTKINFPREALILSAIEFAFITLGIRLLILAPTLLYFGLLPGVEILYAAPIALVFLVLLGSAIGVALAPIGALYKDIQQGLTVVVTFWMFVTPVVFTSTREGVAGLIMNLNPVTHVLVPARAWLTGQTVAASELTGFIVVCGASILLLILGWLNFKIVLPRIIERMGM